MDSSQLEVKETEVAETTNNDNAPNNNDDNRGQSIREEFIKLLKDNDPQELLSGAYRVQSIHGYRVCQQAAARPAPGGGD